MEPTKCAYDTKSRFCFDVRRGEEECEEECVSAQTRTMIR